jgi:hypothetical protein
LHQDCAIPQIGNVALTLRRREESQQLEVDAEHDRKSHILRAKKASSGGTRGGSEEKERRRREFGLVAHQGR